jgi:drug/metabolite transporter (DMT)-like permease
MDEIGKPAASRVAIATALGGIYLLWGSTYLAIRFAIETLPPLLMAGTRFLIAGSLLYGWVRLRGGPRPVARNWRSAAVVGGLLLLGGNGSVTLSERWVPSGLAALLIATVPLCMVLLEWLRPGGVRPRAGAIAGVLLGLGGVALLVGPAGTGGAASVDRGGAALLIFASLSWSVGSIYSRSASLPSSPLLATAMEMLCGSALLLGLGLALGEGSQVHLASVTLRSGLALAHLIVFGSLVAFSCYVWLLRVSSPAVVSTYAFANPMVAVLLGWALAGERLDGRTWAATAIIVTAVALITLSRRSASPAPTTPRAAAEPLPRSPGSEPVLPSDD